MKLHYTHERTANEHTSKLRRITVRARVFPVNCVLQRI